MSLRASLIAACLVLGSCGSAESTIEDRIAGVGKDCSFLASEASLETSGLAQEKYCSCMVNVLKGWPENDAAAVSHTLAYMSKESLANGHEFERLAATLRTSAKAENAPNSAVALGIGVNFVDDLIKTVDARASGNEC